MSVKMIFCSSTACFKKEVDYVEYILMLPVKYEDLKNNVKYTDGFVIYNENVIQDFWRVFSTSSFIPYKCERLEIIYNNTCRYNLEGFGYD